MNKWKRFGWLFTLYILPIVVWKAMIYYSSSQPYQKQDLRPMLSNFDLSWVERLFSWVEFTYSKRVVSVEQLGAAHFIEFFIRKGAHLFVFAVLGFLVYRLLLLVKLKVSWRVAITVVTVILFASFDEFRQSLNPDRTALVQDVILDTVGGVIGLLIALGLYRKK